MYQVVLDKASWVVKNAPKASAYTCVCPPALSKMLVVASVAELGKQVNKEETRFERPWARSSYGKRQEGKTGADSELVEAVLTQGGGG